ncbi:hypothetical protein W065_03524, partial [Mycobacterium tuberculosis TB_RSA155]
MRPSRQGEVGEVA